MSKHLKKIIPWRWQHELKLWRLERYIAQNQEEVPRNFQENLQSIKALSESPILFAGHIKSGNTWLRFLIFNYFNILHNSAESPLTYRELNNEFQKDSLGSNVPICGALKGYPYLVRTHMRYTSLFSFFQKGIFIYRNPLDTLVSSFHFNRERYNPPIDINLDIDTYVLNELVSWEAHLKSYLGQQRFFKITYEDLKQDPMAGLKGVIEYMGYSFDTSAGMKSTELSDFKSIKQMGREQNQMYGNGGKQFKGEFARKGKVGSFYDELKPETISRAKYLFKKYGFENIG